MISCCLSVAVPCMTVDRPISRLILENVPRLRPSISDVHLGQFSASSRLDMLTSSHGATCDHDLISLLSFFPTVVHASLSPLYIHNPQTQLPHSCNHHPRLVLPFPFPAPRPHIPL